MSRAIAVVGAGWSGLACALELVRHGQPVTLIDAAPQVGGRARGVDVALGDARYRLDNGQHLLIGAYRDTLRLMRSVGVDPDAALLRMPFDLRYPDGFALRAVRLPAPLHLALGLLGARHLSWAARRHALRWVRRWRRARWRVPADAPAIGLFDGAPEVLLRRLWRPLCLAALNVELDAASAQTLLTVLRDALDADAHAADLLIPRCDLSAAFAQPALDELRRRATDVRLGAPALALARLADGSWRVDGRGTACHAQAVVLALPPTRAADLLFGVGADELQPAAAALRAVGSAPIATAYLRYPASVQLPRPAYALLDDAPAQRYGQWVFDRGRLAPDNAGVLSVVISAAGLALQQEPEALVTAVARQLSGELGLPAPIAGALIAEKRATIVPAPNLVRPPARLPLPGLFLAGDSAASEYPSTLEGSVRSGLAAAAAVLVDAPPAR